MTQIREPPRIPKRPGNAGAAPKERGRGGEVGRERGNTRQRIAEKDGLRPTAAAVLPLQKRVNLRLQVAKIRLGAARKVSARQAIRGGIGIVPVRDHSGGEQERRQLPAAHLSFQSLHNLPDELLCPQEILPFAGKVNAQRHRPGDGRRIDDERRVRDGNGLYASFHKKTSTAGMETTGRALQPC